nr:MAG TPA: hypothetical protein [Caudoviricetes sp.]
MLLDSLVVHERTSITIPKTISQGFLTIFGLFCLYFELCSKNKL